MDKESRNAFVVVGVVLVALLAIGLVFSGRPGDAVIGDAPVAHGEAGHEDAAEEAHGEEAGAEESVAEAPGVEVAGEPPLDAPEEPQAELTGLAPEEEAAEAEAAATEPDAVSEEPVEEAHEVALAGDPEAGEKVFRQCQACHQVGDDAENRVGPHLNGVVGRAVASAEGFTYSDSLAALGQEGREWSPDELRGFLANPREYVPGTAMAYAGVRAEDDLENLIAYLATFE